MGGHHLDRAFAARQFSHRQLKSRPRRCPPAAQPILRAGHVVPARLLSRVPANPEFTAMFTAALHTTACDQAGPDPVAPPRAAGLPDNRPEAFIAENWKQPLDTQQIAAAVGVSPRTILRYFRKKYGETPRAYLRRVRLERAHQMLLAAQEPDSVVAIAFLCGFRGLGHFAEAYRRSYGELPSLTLKRAIEAKRDRSR
jgi:AraC-like DNA-binding protein